MMGYGWGAGWMWMFGVPLMIGLVVAAAVIAFNAYGLVGRRGDMDELESASRRGQTRAREHLDERYASGEISTEEYEERRRTLDEFR